MNSEHKFTSMDEIGQAVDNKGGVLSLSMSSLRDASGKGRLGINVLHGIQENLRGLGLGHYPRELPNNQNEIVRLYRYGNPLAELIEAVFTPGEENDELLRRRSEQKEADVLRQVRELVCE